jgi:hypothetical protein
VDRFGSDGSYSSVRRLAQKLKEQSPDATCILDSAPGDAAQVDFGKGPKVKNGVRLAIFQFKQAIRK